MRKFLKWTAISLGVVSLVIVCLGILLVSRLPSPSEIGRSFRKDDVAEASRQSSQISESPKDSTESKTSPAEPTKEVSNAAANSGSKTTSADEKAVNEYFVSRFLTTDASARVDVCAHLDAARDESDRGPGFGRALIDVATQKKRGDPYVEAVLAPAAYIFAIPSVEALIREVVQSKETGNSDSLVTKTLFYSRLAVAAADVVRKKEQINRASDGAYLLYNFTKALRENPSLIGDERTKRLCQSLQSRALSVEVDSQQIREELETFLQAGGVSHSSIGYDPSYHSQVEVRNNEKGIQVKIPWMESIVNPRGTE